MLRYPHTITVTRTSGATRSSTGGWTGGSSSTVYAGRADVQDGQRVFRNAGGSLVDEGDATVFVPGKETSVEPGDSVAISPAIGGRTSATVASVDHLTPSFVVRYT